MKKTVIPCLVILIFSLKSYAQEANKNEPYEQNYNELRLNALFLLIGAFDISYERTLTEESGVGIEMFIPYDNDISDDINYYISPYYRFYFGNKYAAGFFLEGFGMLNSVNIQEYDNYYFSDSSEIQTEEVTDFALGIGLGGKWITQSGFVGELSGGFGRNLFEDYDNTNGSEFVGKFAISVGYRF